MPEPRSVAQPDSPTGAPDRPMDPRATSHVHWRAASGIVNLRGNPQDPAFRLAAGEATGVDLPVSPGGIAEAMNWRVVPVGPDDWFLIGPPQASGAMIETLGRALAGQHVAITDVGSGYRLLQLTGPGAAERLAQGCPLDLHPRGFGKGRCAGSHFFKASIWLWRTDDGFELLVRRSFQGYVQLMLERGEQY